jgi:integrase
MVKTWYAGLAPKTPTMRAHAYSLLRAVLSSEVTDDLLVANPCRVRGASLAKRQVKIAPASLAELEAITAAMPERLRMLTLLAAWAGLRFGELAELRVKDVDLERGVLLIQRGVVRIKGAHVVGTPKSEAGQRSVAIPPHLLDGLAEHLRTNCADQPDALLFPGTKGGHLSPASLYDVYYPARETAGRADLRFHDLRHTGAVLAAQTGATLADLMRRLGRSTPQAAMRYQHSTDDRDSLIASALSDFATARVVQLRPRSADTA